MIEGLSDREKSVLLAKAMGWEVYPGGHIALPADTMRSAILSFYDTANMALAWRVLNWAYECEHIEDQGRYFVLLDWLDEAHLHIEAPADAQRLWLDKVLTLAIEAGIVEVER